MNHQSDIIIYQTQDGLTKIDVSFDQDTVWLSLEQMAELFQRDRTVIGRHIKNIFSEGELQRDSVCAKFAHTADKSTMPFPEKQPQRLFITGQMPRRNSWGYNQYKRGRRA